MTSLVDEQEPKRQEAEAQEAPEANNNNNNMEEDSVIFGSINTLLADALADRIDASLAEGVSELPLLSSSHINTDNNERANQLLKTLQQKYVRNVDLLEIYAGRNIFTLKMFLPRRRQRILHEFLHGKAATAAAATTKDTNNNATEAKQEPTATSSISVSSSYQYPTKDLIPSADAIAQIEQEMQELRSKLKAARLVRNELLVTQKSIEMAQQVSATAADAANSLQQQASDELNNENNVHDSVTAAVMGSTSLEELVKEGKQLMTKLDDSKRERGSDSLDEDGDDDVMDSSSKKKRLGLEEHYREDRKTNKITTTSLTSVKSLLKKK
jgi:hypothetical protein